MDHKVETALRKTAKELGYEYDALLDLVFYEKQKEFDYEDIRSFLDWNKNATVSDEDLKKIYLEFEDVVSADVAQWDAISSAVEMAVRERGVKLKPIPTKEDNEND